MVKRNILFCIPAETFGGAEKSTLDLISDLLDDFSVHVIFKSSRPSSFGHSIISRVHHIFSDDAEEMALFINRINPDIIQFYNSIIFPLAIELSGSKAYVIQVLHANHLLEEDFKPIPNFFTDCYVGVSDSAFAHYPSVELEGKRTLTIPHGVEFDPNRIKKEFSSITTLVSHGRIDFNSKHIDEMIRPFLIRKNSLQLHLYGEGPDDSKLKKIIAGSMSIHLHPFRSLVHLSHFDAYTSWSRSEGFGLSILESLSQGLPIIMRRCWGISENLQNNLHVLFFENEDEFEDSIEKLKDPTFARFLSKNAIELVKEEYGRQAMIKKYQDLYLSCAK